MFLFKMRKTKKEIMIKEKRKTKVKRVVLVIFGLVVCLVTQGPKI